MIDVIKQTELRAVLGFCVVLACAMLLAGSARAAFISEIDFGGPAGQGIELSGVFPDKDYTIVFMSASPTSNSLFGMVIDTLYVPAGTGRAGVALLTDTPWPNQPLLAASLASVPLQSGHSQLPLINDLLMVVMDGQTDLQRFNNPVTDPVAAARYDETLVTDWLVLSAGDQSSTYQNNFDISAVNANLGIDLLSRLFDRGGGSVLARARYPGEVIDMDTFVAGDPDPVSARFDVDNGAYTYKYTPGLDNLPLAVHLPEPGSLMVLGIGSVVCLRRRR